MAYYETRVIWEGTLLESTDHEEFEHTAEAHYSSTLDKYRRSDNSEGVTVQLLRGDDVLYEYHFD